jgi:type II secretory pathway pseudopilin PulG
MRVQIGASAVQPAGKQLRCRGNKQLARKAILRLRFRSSRLLAGYSLIEVVLAAGIVALVYGMILNCYMQSGLRAQWAGYSLAAESLAAQQIEQARAAKWDPNSGSKSVCNITNLVLLSRSYNSNTLTWTGYTTNLLDVPYASTNFTVATNFVTIQLVDLDTLTTNPPHAYFIRVDTVWPFEWQRKRLYFTNTIGTYLGPDNRNL